MPDRVVVTGSRHWDRPEIIYARLEELKAANPLIQIAHGQSPGGGVDLYVEEFCRDLQIVQYPYPPKIGKEFDGFWPYAGLKRNERMVLDFDPELILGFRAPGKSNGTDHCCGLAKKYNIDLEVITYE